MTLDAIGDRSRSEATLAVAATWIAFMAGLMVGGDLTDPVSLAIGGVSGAALVVVGFAAAWRCRTLHRSATVNRLRLTLLSLAVGATLGLCNLAANWTIAAADPRIRAVLVERMATLGPLEALIASPIVEEVAVRLFLMSAMAWVVLRVTKSTRVAFGIALVGSALVFALLHLGRPFPGDPVLANYYRAALMTKYTLAGLPMGWLYWRWGLPYAMVCHAAVNATHLLVQRFVF